jgi:hypothetical protein
VVTAWHVNPQGWLYLEGPGERPQMVWHRIAP